MAIKMCAVCIHTWTMLTTDITLPTPVFHVLGLDVSHEVEAGLGEVVTISAAVLPVLQSCHLCSDCAHSKICRKENQKQHLAIRELTYLFVVCLVVLTVSIHTFTNFSADITLPAPALRVLRLNMPLHISTTLGGVSAVSARMPAVFQSGHLG